MRIIAHRGASGFAPENTLAAFEKAILMGAKEIELDVQMSKDGELVVIHDYFLNRTTSGTGLVMETSYNDLVQYDAGKWFGEIFLGQKIPLLSQVLSLCHKEITVHIEIKKAILEKRDIEIKVYELVKELKMVNQVIISSFDHQCLKNLAFDKELRIGMLLASRMIQPISYMDQNNLLGYSINQSAEFVDEEFVKEAHAKNVQVLVYTVNDKMIANYLKSIGVDGIFTNYPDLLN